VFLLWPVSSHGADRLRHDDFREAAPRVERTVEHDELRLRRRQHGEGEGGAQPDEGGAQAAGGLGRRTVMRKYDGQEVSRIIVGSSRSPCCGERRESMAALFTTDGNTSLAPALP
jgi:hypothetical protein